MQKEALSALPEVRRTQNKTLMKIGKHWQLYLMLLIPIVYLLIFKYQPMYGVQIAFRDFNPALGIMGSPWRGMKHFINFFNSREFVRLLKNTILLGLYSMLVSIPCPILLAVALNEAKSRFFSKSVQMVTYAPYFISTVILVSMVTQFLAMRGGMLNNFRALFGMEPINLMGDPKAFRSIYIISGIWQGTGYGAVIYVAALAGINPELYEAAKIDGATILQKIWNIDLPGIMPTVIMLMILNCGSIINVGYEKVLLLQTPLNMDTSDVISTYVYRIGIQNAQYSYSAAIGLFNSVVSILLLLIANKFAGRVSETSLF